MNITDTQRRSEANDSQQLGRPTSTGRSGRREGIFAEAVRTVPVHCTGGPLSAHTSLHHGITPRPRDTYADTVDRARHIITTSDVPSIREEAGAAVGQLSLQGTRPAREETETGTVQGPRDLHAKEIRWLLDAQATVTATDRGRETRGTAPRQQEVQRLGHETATGPEKRRIRTTDAEVCRQDATTDADIPDHHLLADIARSAKVNTSEGRGGTCKTKTTITTVIVGPDPHHHPAKLVIDRLARPSTNVRDAIAPRVCAATRATLTQTAAHGAL
ncbi:hypothetical protein EJ03DRAFT_351944 [Teratosphaeria nubilosa]|uniref:Uncharacterized protein n=1 Tax=Teratosphaeria nubilosa TaxID=161662 RepID=A0A6G1L7Z6_9PEZI|nr:hypothetical protein EJ03DRAFT_351944 [Teratosphaeria nubilosa]